MQGKDLHLDCFSGLAGDMFLGACLDLGLPLAVVDEAVAALALPDVALEARRARRGGFAGTRFRVLERGRPIEGPDPEEAAHGADAAEASSRAPRSHAHGRHLSEILKLIDGSALAAPVKARAGGLFHRLGEAEAKAHGLPVERVHFHEVGALDSIVDLTGAAAAIEWLAPRRITCGTVALGSGTVHGAHGEMPVPPPAVAELVRGIPVRSAPGGELLTPTGAVLLAELVDEFCELPPLVVEGVGVGLGRKEIAGRANAVRLFAGRPAGGESPAEVMVVECEVDDLSGEGLGHALARLLEEGALDAYLTPVQMKKGRPGSLISLLCRRADLERLAGMLLAESGSLGCRFSPAGRFEAAREIVPVATRFGEVQVKRASFLGRPVAEAPEYEDCRRLAAAAGVTWREVYQAALAAALAERRGG